MLSLQAAATLTSHKNLAPTLQDTITRSVMLVVVIFKKFTFKTDAMNGSDHINFSKKYIKSFRLLRNDFKLRIESPFIYRHLSFLTLSKNDFGLYYTYTGR